MKAIEKMRTFLLDFQKARKSGVLSGVQANRLKTVLNQVLKGKGTKKQLSAELDVLQSELATVMIKELAKKNPKLAAINENFSFYKGLEDIIKETQKRQVGQKTTNLFTAQQATRTGVGATVGATVGSAL